METPTRTNTLKITVNPNPTTEVDIGGWDINTTQALEKEPERVDIEKDGRSYSIIFTTDGVKVEVWDVNERGEISALLSSTDLPE